MFQIINPGGATKVFQYKGKKVISKVGNVHSVGQMVKDIAVFETSLDQFPVPLF